MIREQDTINPTNLRQALAARARPNVTVIAGGTDILVQLHDQIDKPWPRLLVLDRVSALRKIAIHDDYIFIGPLVTFSEIENSKILRKYAPQLCRAASVAGSIQIRNRATIGGNIANGSPAGDTIPPLYVLDAAIELSSAQSKRVVPIDRFFTGPGKTVLKSTELITAIKIPKARTQGFFCRLGTRKALAISKVSVAANLWLKSDKIVDAMIALGAVAPTVVRATLAEKILRGNRLDMELIDRAAEAAISEARPIDDIRSIASYRKEMVGVLLKRGLTEILESMQ
jgi:carbon-monoxide dehydrogenase medium subunit